MGEIMECVNCGYWDDESEFDLDGSEEYSCPNCGSDNVMMRRTHVLVNDEDGALYYDM
jgi:DNA-directed RNA polymerase subunit RPC12/RpoP